MKRVLTSLSLALLLAITGSTAFDVAKGPDAGQAIAAKAYKTCKSKLSTGKIKTWRCGTDQACCVNKTLNTYVCGLPGLGCL
jgi:hypothetical protein